MAKFLFDDLEKGKMPDATVTIYDDDRRPLVLGAEQQLGRAGAGGSVYEITSAPGYCVKLFNPQDLADQKKRSRIVSGLEAMVDMSPFFHNPRLAWPLGIVRDKNGAAVGYVMHRIPSDFKPFRALFGGPTLLSRRFPNWGRRELALTARNFGKTLLFLERQGVHVADFNPENFVVNDCGEVMFLDCDSFMFFDRSGKMHASDMYFPDCAAPEILANPSAVRQARTKEQTRFSAAVISFMLVMAGMHPYSFSESLDGGAVGTPAQNILAGKCALGSGTGCRMIANLYNLWSWLTSALQIAFKTTFRTGHSCPTERTPLEDLVSVLDKFALVCGQAPERNTLTPSSPRRREANGFKPYPTPAFGHRPFVPNRGPIRQQMRFPRPGGYRPFGTGNY